MISFSFQLFHFSSSSVVCVNLLSTVIWFHTDSWEEENVLSPPSIPSRPLSLCSVTSPLSHTPLSPHFLSPNMIFSLFRCSSLPHKLHFLLISPERTHGEIYDYIDSNLHNGPLPSLKETHNNLGSSMDGRVHHFKSDWIIFTTFYIHYHDESTLDHLSPKTITRTKVVLY